MSFTNLLKVKPGDKVMLRNDSYGLTGSIWTIKEQHPDREAYKISGKASINDKDFYWTIFESQFRLVEEMTDEEIASAHTIPDYNELLDFLKL